MKSKYTGIKRILMAFKYSLDGIKTAFNSESAFRQDLLLCMIGWVVLAFVKIGFYAKLTLGVSLVFIIFAELINTAIERIIDRVGPEYHKLSKQAKDIGSAIVCLSIITVGVLWFLVLRHELF